MYEDEYHGLFSRKLADWAIMGMMTRDKETKELKPIEVRTVEEVEEIMKDNDVEVPEEFVYTAWYLFNMTIADYPKSLKDDAVRAIFVKETLFDPDSCPEAVLECFEAKMRLMNYPIYWERMI